MKASPTQRFASSLASVESLESRTLLTGVVTPAIVPMDGSASSTSGSAGIVVHERAGMPFTADLASFVLLAPARNVQATITWGDGTASKGIIKADGVVGLDEIQFEVDGIHTYRRAGVFPIDVVVTQAGPAATALGRFIGSFNDTAIVSAYSTSLNGVINGTYTAAPTSIAIGGEYFFNGTGTAGDLGPVSAGGSLVLPFGASSASGELILTSIGSTAADSGSVTLSLRGVSSTPGEIPSLLTYVISGGTGAFAGATGSGIIKVTLGGNGGNSFEFDITSLLPPAPAA